MKKNRHLIRDMFLAMIILTGYWFCIIILMAWFLSIDKQFDEPGKQAEKNMKHLKEAYARRVPR